jgi:hypothetical protein
VRDALGRLGHLVEFLRVRITGLSLEPRGDPACPWAHCVGDANYIDWEAFKDRPSGNDILDGTRRRRLIGGHHDVTQSSTPRH